MLEYPGNRRINHCLREFGLGRLKTNASGVRADEKFKEYLSYELLGGVEGQGQIDATLSYGLRDF
jgi:hypothetical protein